MSRQRSDGQKCVTRRRFIAASPSLMLLTVPVAADDDAGRDTRQDAGPRIGYRETEHIRNAYRLMRF